MTEQESIFNLESGETFIFKGNKWVALDEVEGGLLVVMAKLWKVVSFSDNESNDYSKSNVRKMLSEYLIPRVGEDNLISHKIDLSSLDIDSNNNAGYGSIEDKVFILSSGEYKKYKEYIPVHSFWYWTCTPLFPKTTDGVIVPLVCTVNQYNRIDSTTYGQHLSGTLPYSSGSVVPAIILNPNTLKLVKQPRISVVEEVERTDNKDDIVNENDAGNIGFTTVKW